MPIEYKVMIAEKVLDKNGKKKVRWRMESRASKFET